MPGLSRRGPVAALDCGTNSFRLLVAEPDGTGLRELTRELQIVRLGQGVDATGSLHPDALARTFAAADGYARRLAELGVAPADRRLVATSAARDADNVADFVAGLRQRLGVAPEVISGAEEARLSFVGALSGVSSPQKSLEMLGVARSTDRATPNISSDFGEEGLRGEGLRGDRAEAAAAGSVLVMDVGGGSTELVLGDAAGTIERSVSLDVGSVRLTERFGLVGPWPPAARAAAAAVVDAELDRLGWPLDGVGTWIGVAGTVTTLSAVAQGLTSYDRSKVHGSVLPVRAVTDQLERLSAATVAEVRALGVEAGRADVLPAGVLIVERVARRVRRPLLVSETDILDGVALDLLHRPPAGDDGRMPR